MARTRRALDEFVIEGVPTTVPFHRRLVDHPVFAAGEATTAFLAEHPEVLPTASDQPQVPATEGTSNQSPRDLTVEVNGRRLAVRVFGAPAVEQPSESTPRRAPRLQKEKTGTARHAPDGAELTSPLQGTIIRVEMTEGATVRRGDLICVVEAMKMENEITAHRDGTVSALTVKAGDSVRIGSVLATIE